MCDEDIACNISVVFLRHSVYSHVLCLILEDVPDQPTMVNVTVSMPNSVVIKVTPPGDTGGMPIIGYIVKYSDVNTGKTARCSNVCCGGTVVETLDSRIYRSLVRLLAVSLSYK